MPSELSVREILQPKVLSCTPDTAVAGAAQSMVEARCSSILVVAEGKAVGIWTERDALALDVSDAAVGRTPIAAVMSSPVKTLGIDSTLGEASLRFREENVRHFVVVDGAGEHRGVISQTDIVLNQGIEYFVSLRELESVFSRRHLTVPSVTRLSEVVTAMHRSHNDAVVVEAPSGVLGILTERDVIRLLAQGRSAETVGEVASFPLLTLPLHSSLFRARKEFVEKHVRHLGVTDADGDLAGLLTFSGILANIEHEYVRHLREALRETEANLAISTRHLRSAAKAFESTFEGILVTNAQKVIESVNPAFTQITGYQPSEVLGKTPAVLSSGRHDDAFYRAMYQALDETGHWQGEICNRRKSGQIYFEWVNINVVKDNAGRVTSYVAVFSDFTTRKAAEEQMRFMAEHDPLTGLPNRTLLTERLSRAIPHAKRNGKHVAVLFLDLDDFKEVNDSLGHDAGDEVLRVVAQRLVKGTRAEDTVARLGGDEFVLVLEDLTDVEHLPAIVDGLMEAIAEPVWVSARELRTATSVGVSLYPNHGLEPEELLRNADTAMYRSKQSGGNQASFFGASSGSGAMVPTSR
jgi:diguanylate cyclase (GGDEF)-like protein/PAS domain S-box-containing protein